MIGFGYKATQWKNYLLYSIAVTLPFIPKYHLLLLIAILVIFYINKNKEKDPIQFIERLPALLLFLFYFYYLFSLLWTENYNAALLDLQIKLPLLILPLVIFYSYPVDRSIRHKIFNYFLYGLDVAVYFCLLRACYFLVATGDNYFLYKEFSYFIHPGYFAMYLSFGSVIILHRLLTVLSMVNFVSYIYWFRVFIYTVAIILLSSKAGIITQGIILISVIILSGKYLSGDLIKKTGLPLVLTIMLIYFGFFSQLTSNRMAELNKTIKEPAASEVHSTTLRLQAWQSAGQVISDNPWCGSGAGDSKNALLEKYQENGFVKIYDLRLNAHNQFLQTAITLGIPGFILLIFILLTGFERGFKKNNWLLVSFICICVLNCMIESILEVSAGTLFFAMFYSLLTDADRV